MARGRFIGKEISLDEKVAALSDDTARLLFTWTIAHLDREGRIYGEPNLIKSQVFPRQSTSVARIEKYLREMENLGLIIRYFDENSSKNGDKIPTNRKNFRQNPFKERYISFPNFEKHQIGLRKDKEAPSVIPSPPSRVNPSILPTNDGATPGKEKISLSKDKDKDKENIKNKTAADLFKDHALDIEKLRGEFPELKADFDSHIKNCLRWWERSGKALKDPVKAARNWLIKERATLKLNPPGNMGRSSQLGQVPTSEELDQEEE